MLQSEPKDGKFYTVCLNRPLAKKEDFMNNNNFNQKALVLMAVSVMMFCQSTLAANGRGYGGPTLKVDEAIPIESEKGFTGEQIHQALFSCMTVRLQVLSRTVYGNAQDIVIRNKERPYVFLENETEKFLNIGIDCRFPTAEDQKDNSAETVCNFSSTSLSNKEKFQLRLMGPGNNLYSVLLTAGLPKLRYERRQNEPTLDIWGQGGAVATIYYGLSIEPTADERYFNLETKNPTHLSYSQDALVSCISTNLQQVAK